jgi:hypothetical protein
VGLLDERLDDIDGMTGKMVSAPSVQARAPSVAGNDENR